MGKIDDQLKTSESLIKDIFEKKWAKRPWRPSETTDKDKALYWFRLGTRVCDKNISED